MLNVRNGKGVMMEEFKIKKVRPVFCDELPSYKDTVTEGLIYISKKYEIAMHLCPCGCGGESVTPFNEGEWKLTIDESNKVTLYPSILNTNCPNKAHYHIKSNHIIKLGE